MNSNVRDVVESLLSHRRFGMDVHEDCTIYVHFCTEYLAEDGI